MRWLLILLLPGIAWGQAAFRAQSTLVETGAAASITLDLDTITGLTDGDLMLAFVHINDNIRTGDAVTGWTVISECNQSEGGGFDRSTAIWYKVASSESGTVQFDTMGATNEQHAGVVLAYSGVDQSTPIDATSTYIAIENDTTPTNAAITLANAGLVILTGNGVGGWDPVTAPTNYTERVDDDLGAVTGEMFAADRAGLTSGTETPGAWTTGSSGDDDGNFCTIALRDAGGGTTPLRRRRN